MLRNLGDGLILRRGVSEDADALAKFFVQAFTHPDTGAPLAEMGPAILDMMRGHPALGPSDFTVLQDTRSGAIVSAMNLISQTWTYGGIAFGVGMAEPVATHADYRRRGLVRAQFEIMHQWSAARGEKVQSIWGIPNYYRQFGYAYALEIIGGRFAFEPQIPKLPEGEAEPYRVHAAREADVPLLMELHNAGNKRYLVACVHDETLWRYEVMGRREESIFRRALGIIETAEGEPIGYLNHAPKLWRSTFSASAYELKLDVSFAAVTSSVLRYLWATGKEFAARQGSALHTVGFRLGSEHPVYLAMPRVLTDVRAPEALYIRVPDLPAFLQHIASVLEARLAASVIAGHSGAFKLSFYRDGAQLNFERGRLISVERWQPIHTHTDESGFGDAAFPPLTFLQLLFGYRSLSELQHAFTDCIVEREAHQVLLNALFPKQVSQAWVVA